MEGLSAEQRAHLAAYWWQRAEGEITSWLGFQHVLDDLRTENAPAALVALAERAVLDEHRHALWCRDWARRFGRKHMDDPRPYAERPVNFPGVTPTDNRALRIALCCFTETVGCFILRRSRPVITHSELRKLNRRHLADELQHSRVGWGYLATLGPARRDLVRRHISLLLDVLPDVTCRSAQEERDDLVPFGYFTPSLLQAAHDEAVAEVILPGLEHLGLGAAA
jgi:hypothetical protein